MSDTAVAAEPERGCLNCGAALALADARPAHYCPDCGQETDPRPPTVVELVRQLLSHYASAEGRLWPTLVGLIGKPGHLTAEYLAGRRRRYIIPTRLYLTTSILFFILVKVLGAGNLGNVENRVEPKPATGATKTTGARPAQEIPKPAEIARGALEEARKDFQKEFAKAQTRSRATGAPLSIQIGPDGKGAGMDDSVQKVFECETESVQCRKIKDWLADRYGNITVREFIARLKDRMMALAPYAMFMLLPVFAMLTWLLYWRRRLYYSEHLVYALHVHSFAFLLLLTISVLPKGIGDLLWFVGAAYFWLAMRKVFGGRWWMTTLRWGVLSMVYPILLSFSIVFTLAIAILLV